jgi:hypothetical protein
MGERNAVDTKSGKSVSHSDPGLRRPTLPATVGLKPTARPATADSDTQSKAREAAESQPKNGRGSGQSPAIRVRCEAPGSFTLLPESSSTPIRKLGDSEVKALIQFFEILDRWEKEAHGSQIM